MTHQDSVTHDELAERLRSCIAHLREDVEARADPVLTEIAHALTLMADIALDDRARIDELEASGPRKA